MELRLERPSAPGEYESWATIMERVSGDVTNAGMRESTHGSATGRRRFAASSVGRSLRDVSTASDDYGDRRQPEQVGPGHRQRLTE